MRSLLIALLAIPAASMGANPAPPEPAAANQRRIQNELHLLRIIGLADALGLNEAEALRLDRLMRPYDERKRKVRAQIGEALKVIKLATEGDPAALASIDPALETVLNGRAQVAEIDRDMLLGVSRELTPQQRAKMAVFFARFGQHARQVVANVNKLNPAQQPNDGQSQAPSK
jgi:hypothetical protein